MKKVRFSFIGLPEFPDLCPNCLSKPADAMIPVWVGAPVVYLMPISWPHCAGCSSAHAQKERAKRLLGVSILLGIVVFVGFVAAQFCDTGIPDSKLLSLGIFLALGIIGWGSMVTVACALKGRSALKGFRAGPGVRLKSFWWEGDQPYPLPGRPMTVTAIFVNDAYADAFAALNPEERPE